MQTEDTGDGDSASGTGGEFGENHGPQKTLIVKWEEKESVLKKELNEEFSDVVKVGIVTSLLLQSRQEHVLTSMGDATVDCTRTVQKINVSTKDRGLFLRTCELSTRIETCVLKRPAWLARDNVLDRAWYCALVYGGSSLSLSSSSLSSFFSVLFFIFHLFPSFSLSISFVLCVSSYLRRFIASSHFITLSFSFPFLPFSVFVVALLLPFSFRMRPFLICFSLCLTDSPANCMSFFLLSLSLFPRLSNF